jgi:hypothetical protein
MLEISEKDCYFGELSSGSSKELEISTIAIPPPEVGFLDLITSSWNYFPFFVWKCMSTSKKWVNISIIEEFISPLRSSLFLLK